VARRGESVLGDLATLPWWVSVVLAAIVYFGLRFFLPAISADDRVTQSIVKAAAKVAPFFALLFLFPVPLSLLNAAKRRRLLNSQIGLSTIRALHWSEFELMVGEAFRRQGYAVEERGGSAPDGGIDLLLHKDGEKTIVQCKHWKKQQIGVSVVRELLGVMVESHADRGILVSSSRFTFEAQEFSRGKQIDVMDGEALYRLLPFSSDTDKVEPAMHKAESSIRGDLCSLCGSEMVKRVAMKGRDVGKAFWGCSKYPKCTETRSI
jgi:restriction system protein